MTANAKDEGFGRQTVAVFQHNGLFIKETGRAGIGGERHASLPQMVEQLFLFVQAKDGLLRAGQQGR